MSQLLINLVVTLLHLERHLVRDLRQLLGHLLLKVKQTFALAVIYAKSSLILAFNWVELHLVALIWVVAIAIPDLGTIDRAHIWAVGRLFLLPFLSSQNFIRDLVWSELLIGLLDISICLLAMSVWSDWFDRLQHVWVFLFLLDDSNVFVARKIKMTCLIELFLFDSFKGMQILPHWIAIISARNFRCLWYYRLTSLDVF